MPSSCSVIFYILKFLSQVDVTSISQKFVPLSAVQVILPHILLQLHVTILFICSLVIAALNIHLQISSQNHQGLDFHAPVITWRYQECGTADNSLEELQVSYDFFCFLTVLFYKALKLAYKFYCSVLQDFRFMYCKKRQMFLDVEKYDIAMSENIQ